MPTDQLEECTLEATDAITTRNRTVSPLLRLPGEVRNTIYSYVLRVDYTADSQLDQASGNPSAPLLTARSSTGGYPTRRVNDLLREAHLSRTCRQLHEETAQLPFTLNTFQVFDANMAGFMRRTPQAIRMMIRELVLPNLWSLLRLPHLGTAALPLQPLALLRNLPRIKKLVALRTIRRNRSTSVPVDTDHWARIQHTINQYAGRSITIEVVDVYHDS